MLYRYASILLFILACIAVPLPVSADEKDNFSVSDLERVEAERDKVLKRLKKLEKSGKKVDRELQEIDNDLVIAAADSRRREEAANDAQQTLNELEIREINARGELLSDREALSDILATLMSFGSKRPPALTTSPEDTSSAIRAAILMGDIAPKLAEKAESLAIELEQLAKLQADIHNEKEDLARAEQTLLARRDEIEALHKEKRAKRIELAKATMDLNAQNDALAKEADTLQALLSSIISKAPTAPSMKPPPPRKFAKHKKNKIDDAALKKSNRLKLPPTSFGNLSGIQRPAIGRLINSYGSIDSISSQKSKGQTWSTRKGAQVVAPKDGRVEYAGVFRTYGQILILDLGEDYLMVLAGLDSIYAEAGQSVLGGEPLGRMEDSAKQRPELYIELRHKGSIVDPELLLSKSTTGLKG